MKITISRYSPGSEAASLKEYELALENPTVLEALEYLKQKKDATLTYSSGCRSSVCGSCAVRVNGSEVLACGYKLQEGDVIEPLNNLKVLKDLVVDLEAAYEFNTKAKTYLQSSQSGVSLTPEDESRNELQSDCIMCGSCFSACPVYAVNGEFLGPFSLTRVWRYVSDKREEGEADKIANVQTNGVWDCTLCNGCSIVCPQGISSKADIEKLRSKSAQHGFMDPNFGASFGGGFGSSFDGSPSF